VRTLLADSSFIPREDDKPKDLTAVKTTEVKVYSTGTAPYPDVLLVWAWACVSLSVCVCASLSLALSLSLCLSVSVHLCVWPVC
jgi:hypothetical protein